ncbi:MAG: M42 family metallopeptidase [Armatimonadota bacterium]|nr:M42 family metallopeptidase [Armatimonadota bacterium]MDR5696943.1 M42 family metallopeptidase [Armatimonadota bacterium]
MYDTMQMLREITEAPGVPGFEEPVRQVMHKYLSPLGEILHDRLGSIVARKEGSAAQPKVIVAGHMDEIGFLVTRITDEGYVKFQTLGGWWSQVMLAQRVQVLTRRGPVLGVIGSKPPHILQEEERKKAVEIKDLYIDVGASDREEAQRFGIRPGDPIVPTTPFTVMRNDRLLMAKAWDNRFGCAAMIEILRALQDIDHPNTVYGVGNVQEEVGLRGAQTTAHLVQPDIGIALDTGIAGDTPGIKPDEAQGKLGRGPVIFLYDGSMIPHVRLRDLVIEIAESEGIPYQFDHVARGGTDAGKIHVFGTGVPSIVIGAPVRYIHSHNAILHRDDFDNAVRLCVALIQRLDRATVERIAA